MSMKLLMKGKQEGGDEENALCMRLGAALKGLKGDEFIRSWNEQFPTVPLFIIRCCNMQVTAIANAVINRVFAEWVGAPPQLKSKL